MPAFINHLIISISRYEGISHYGFDLHFPKEMAGWHHRLDGHEFEYTPGVCDGQGGLVCCDSWGHKESDTTERLN